MPKILLGDRFLVFDPLRFGPKIFSLKNIFDKSFPDCSVVSSSLRGDSFEFSFCDFSFFGHFCG